VAYEEVRVRVLRQRGAHGVRRLAGHHAAHDGNIAAVHRGSRLFVRFRRTRSGLLTEGRDEQPRVESRHVDADIVQFDFVRAEISRGSDVLSRDAAAADDRADGTPLRCERFDDFGVSTHPL